MKPSFLPESSAEWKRDKEAAFKFHEAMLSMNRWLRKQLDEQKQQKQKQTKPPSDELALIANNLHADASHLSPTEYAIFKLTDVKVNEETNKINLHFSLPSEFRYEPWVHAFVSDTMDKIEKIWGYAIKEIGDEYKRKYGKEYKRRHGVEFDGFEIERL